MEMETNLEKSVKEEFIIDNMEDMCNLMCNNQVPEKMNRKELANKMFMFLKYMPGRLMQMVVGGFNISNEANLIDLIGKEDDNG